MKYIWYYILILLLNDGTLYYDTINAIVKRTCSENIKNEEINNKIVDEKEVERRKYVSMYIQAKLSLIWTNDNYINKIDVLVSKYDNIKLEKLFNKVKNIQNKNNILKYLEAKIYLKLNNKEVEEFNQSTDENAKYVTEYTINETSDKNAKTILEKYWFSWIKETVETQFWEDMLKKQLVLAILWEYHIKDYKYLKDNPVAYKEYLKWLEEIEEYKTK